MAITATTAQDNLAKELACLMVSKGKALLGLDNVYNAELEAVHAYKSSVIRDSFEIRVCVSVGRRTRSLMNVEMLEACHFYDIGLSPSYGHLGAVAERLVNALEPEIQKAYRNQHTGSLRAIDIEDEQAEEDMADSYFDASSYMPTYVPAKPRYVKPTGEMKIKSDMVEYLPKHVDDEFLKSIYGKDTSKLKAEHRSAASDIVRAGKRLMGMAEVKGF